MEGERAVLWGEDQAEAALTRSPVPLTGQSAIPAKCWASRGSLPPFPMLLKPIPLISIQLLLPRVLFTPGLLLWYTKSFISVNALIP